MLRFIMDDAYRSDDYRHLEERYAQMSDAKIEAMSEQMDDLTEIAQSVLRAEMAKRGLGSGAPGGADDPVEAARRAVRAEFAARGTEEEERRTGQTVWDRFVQDDVPPALDPSAYQLFPVWTVSDEAEARIIMNLLQSAGVKAYLGPEKVETVEDYHGSYEHGVEVKVMNFQAKFATEGLRRFGPRDAWEEAIQKDYAIACPNCKSEDVVFESLAVEPGKEPGTNAKYHWTCDACGHHWTDEGIEEAV